MQAGASQAPAAEAVRYGAALSRRPLGGHGGGGAERRGRGVSGLRPAQRPPGRGKFHPGAAAGGGKLLPSPGSEGIPHRQHPPLRPGVAPGGGPAAAGQPVRRGRGHRPGLGPGGPGPEDRPGPAPPRLHPDDRPHPGRGGGGRTAGNAVRSAGPGAEPGGRGLHLPEQPHRHRGLRSRGAVHVLVRPVRHERPHRTAQRQPGRLRPALPPALPF